MRAGIVREPHHSLGFSVAFHRISHRKGLPTAVTDCHFRRPCPMGATGCRCGSGKRERQAARTLYRGNRGARGIRLPRENPDNCSPGGLCSLRVHRRRWSIGEYNTCLPRSDRALLGRNMHRHRLVLNYHRVTVLGSRCLSRRCQWCKEYSCMRAASISRPEASRRIDCLKLEYDCYFTAQVPTPCSSESVLVLCPRCSKPWPRAPDTGDITVCPERCAHDAGFCSEARVKAPPPVDER